MLKVEGGKSRTVKAGESLSRWSPIATDDGIPKPRPMPRLNPGFASRFTVDSATGLRLSWFLYRGGGQGKARSRSIPCRQRSGRTRETAELPVGLWVEDALRCLPTGSGSCARSFSEPGTYVLRCLAHDGGLATAEDVTVVVTP